MISSDHLEVTGIPLYSTALAIMFFIVLTFLLSLSLFPDLQVDLRGMAGVRVI